jgi:hypothetical protein
MSKTPDPGKRIPKSLGTDTQFLGNYSLVDLAVAGLPGVAVVLITQILLPPSLVVRGIPVSTLTIPLAGLAIAVGVLFVSLTPNYVTSWEWLGIFLGFRRSERALDHEAAKAYTHVDRLYPRHDALERTDGAVVGAVEVSPPTMALATDEEWAQKTDAFQDFVNTTVEFPIQIYSTTQPFPADAYLSQYEQRLSDPDVADNEHLQTLLEEYIDWYEAELAQRQMTIRDHYILIPVTPREVHHERGSLAARLASLPLVGLVVRRVTAPPRSEERAAMLEELADRRRRIARGLRDIEGCTPSPVEMDSLAQLVAEHWTGEEATYGDPDQVLRTTPVVSKS